MMLQLQHANYNFNSFPGFWTTIIRFLLHELQCRYVVDFVEGRRPKPPLQLSGYIHDAGRSATRSRLGWCPRLVQIRVKNTCGHASVKLGMAAIEKLDRLRAGKARIAERRAS